MANSVSTIIYPELRALPSDQRERALRRARRHSLDALELIGIAAGLIVAMMVARYASIRFSAAGLAPALVAVGAALVTVAPFFLRRTRRSLRRMRATPR
jgi:O-antigen/teichoic acid export membrane protein